VSILHDFLGFLADVCHEPVEPLLSHMLLSPQALPDKLFNYSH
jgi:hypothetical protein